MDSFNATSGEAKMEEAARPKALQLTTSKCKDCGKLLIEGTVDYCNKFCKDQSLIKNIQTSKPDSLEKIATQDYTFTKYGIMPSFADLSEFYSMIYIASNTSTFKNMVYELSERFCELPSTVNAAESTEVTLEEILLVVHNLSQIIQRSDAKITIDDQRPLIHLIGFINRLRSKTSMELLNKLIPDYSKLKSYPEQTIYFFYYLMALGIGMLRNDGQPIEDEAKEQIAKMFSDEVKDDTNINLSPILITDGGYATILRFENDMTSPANLDVWVSSTEVYRFCVLTGDDSFDKIPLARLKAVLLSTTQITYPFVFVYKRSDPRGDLIKVVKDTDPISKCAQIGGKLYISKIIGDIPEGSTESIYNTLKDLITFRYKAGEVEVYSSCLSTTRDGDFYPKFRDDLAANMKYAKRDAILGDVVPRYDEMGQSVKNSVFKPYSKEVNLFSFTDNSLQKETVNPSKIVRKMDYTAEEVLKVLCNLESFEQTLAKREFGPQFLVLYTRGLLNEAFGSALLRTITSPSTFLQGHESKVFRVVGFDIEHDKRSIETFLNTEKFNDLFPEADFCDVVSNRKGLTKFSRKTIQIQSVSRIIYELVDGLGD